MSTRLSSPSSLLTGAILAGGHSSRFGSNKALFAPDGETLISKAAGLLRSVAREVLVSASQTNAGDYDFLGLEIVVDQHPDSGPMGGLETLLQRCTTPWLLVLTCDMPFVDKDTLITMISSLTGELDNDLYQRDRPHALAWQRCDGSISPFPLLIERSALPKLQSRMRTGSLSMKGLLSDLDTYYIMSPDNRLLSNINRPEDWAIGENE